MKKEVLTFWILIFFVSVASSQDMGRVKSIIDTLTSPSYHGRGYVEEGDKKAAEFIAEQFSSIGLQAFNNSFFQSFNISINTFPGKLRLKINNKELIPGEDFIVDASSSSFKFKGRACFLDTTLFYDSLARQKFLKEDCNVVLIYRALDYPRIAQLDERLLEKFHCFKGFIELHEGKLTASVSTRQFPKATFQVLQQKLPKDVTKVEMEVDASFIENYKTQNVIGHLPGKVVPDSFVVFTAHYDHLGRMGKEVYFPGANDNASGISMLIELAHYFKNNPEAQKYSLVFMAFAAEEAGLHGSRFYVSAPSFPLEKIKFLINLDLVGTGDDGIAVVNATFHDREFRLLSELNSRNQYFPLIKKRGEAANSDHYFFHLKGVKSFFIYTMGGTKAYHDIYDTAVQLPLTRYSEFFNLMTGFVKQL